MTFAECDQIFILSNLERKSLTSLPPVAIGPQEVQMVKREEVEDVSSTAAQLTLWLSGDIELEVLEVLEGIATLLEVVLDALTRLNRRTPK